MIRGIDHLIIRAGDLDDAIVQYEQLGFTVTPGGRHPHGTHNALISFEDGSYLELIAFWDPAAAGDYWRGRRGGSPGLVHFALASDGLMADVEAIEERELQFSGPNDGARSRPDGVEVAWKTASASEDQNRSLPFLIEDVTARDVRVPGGEATRHENGARGIARVLVSTDDLEAATERYAALLGYRPVSDRSSEARQAEGFQVGPHLIELQVVATDSDGSQHHEGLFAAVLYGDVEREIPPERASGARLRIEARV